MMLAETEFRHQIEATIRSYREVLLGLFFITVGMLLDVRLLLRHSAAGHARSSSGMLLLKAAVVAVVAKPATQELVQVAAHRRRGRARAANSASRC